MFDLGMLILIVLVVLAASIVLGIVAVIAGVLLLAWWESGSRQQRTQTSSPSQSATVTATTTTSTQAGSTTVTQRTISILKTRWFWLAVILIGIFMGPWIAKSLSTVPVSGWKPFVIAVIAILAVLAIVRGKVVVPAVIALFLLAIPLVADYYKEFGWGTQERIVVSEKKETVLKGKATWDKTSPGEELPIEVWSEPVMLPERCGITYSGGYGAVYVVQYQYYSDVWKDLEMGQHEPADKIRFRMLQTGHTSRPYTIECKPRPY
jgi:hypothetical protein